MPTRLDVVHPNRQDTKSAVPEHLALQASPAVVQFAERVHEAFLESIQYRVAAYSDKPVQTTFIGTEQSFLGPHLTNPQARTQSVVIKLDQLAGCIVLRFSSDLLFRILDILLASPANAGGERGEALTDIEFQLLRGFFRIFSETLQESWLPIPQSATAPGVERLDDTFSHLGELHALIMKSTLELDGVEGEVDVVLPAFLVRLAVGSAQTNPNDRVVTDGLTRIAGALGAAKVDIQAVLSNLTIRVGDLADLAQGQILLGDKVTEAPFDCLVNQRVQFRGELVPAGDRYGFHIRGATLDDPRQSPDDK